MKTPIQPTSSFVRVVPLLLAAIGIVLLPVRGAAPETFPTLAIGQQVFTNAVIVRVTSDGLVIRHATGGATVPFADLPEELQQRYGPGDVRPPSKPQPDPAVAADLSRRQREYTEDARRGFLRAQEARIGKQLSGVRDELSRLNQVIVVLSNRARGTGRHSAERAELSRARERKIAVINQISALEADLDRVRDRVLGIP